MPGSNYQFTGNPVARERARAMKSANPDYEALSRTQSPVLLTNKQPGKQKVGMSPGRSDLGRPSDQMGCGVLAQTRNMILNKPAGGEKATR